MTEIDETAGMSEAGRHEWELMVAGEVYQDSHPDIERKRAEAKRLFVEYNKTDYEDVERRREIMERLFKSIGEDVFIEPNFRCEVGRNITIGSHAYINFDCVMLDNAPITLGDYVWIAPMVGLFATNHALDFEERKNGACQAKPIVIGNGVGLGGHVTVLGGDHRRRCGDRRRSRGDARYSGELHRRRQSRTCAARNHGRGSHRIHGTHQGT